MFSPAAIAEIVKIAEKNNLPAAGLLAVAEVESAGRAVWNVNGQELPAIRFEGHYFYRRLKGRKLQTAVNAGLAHPRAGRVKNPRSFSARYAMLARAMKIDERAALESISMGLGQVMGAHWRNLGYKSVQHMFSVAKSGVPGQVDLMVRFIVKNGLSDELRKGMWKKFAYRYNGPAYKKNRYDTKMRTANARWAKRLASGSLPVDAKGEVTGTLFKDQQSKLKRLGFYKGRVDGLDGPKSRAAVRAFQKAHGLRVDGRLGPITDRELDRAIARLDSKNANKTIGTGVGTTGAGGAGKAVEDAVEAIQPAAYDLTWLNYVVLALVLIGLAITCYGLYKKFTADDQITDELDVDEFDDPEFDEEEDYE
jgi:hypothetical protein